MRSTLKRKPAGTGTVAAPQRPRLDPRPCARAAFHGEAGSAPKMALRVLGRGPGARSMAQRPPRKTRRELGEGSEGLTGLGAAGVHKRAPQTCAALPGQVGAPNSPGKGNRPGGGRQGRDGPPTLRVPVACAPLQAPHESVRVRVCA